ncbi:hypothetical protein AAFF_G00085730 [Aldrovandia affinis]|uniref:Uncharacterized protein n=1 Tax=Aldrovandia affinis TaxID=143900 RepID=A0AAD7RWQ3_9TELE|nr:hypothetical protein AAFF_G00085730 [Aldrovandia affinis]
MLAPTAPIQIRRLEADSLRALAAAHSLPETRSADSSFSPPPPKDKEKVKNVERRGGGADWMCRQARPAGPRELFEQETLGPVIWQAGAGEEGGGITPQTPSPCGCQSRSNRVSDTIREGNVTSISGVSVKRDVA